MFFVKQLHNSIDPSVTMLDPGTHNAAHAQSLPALSTPDELNQACSLDQKLVPH